MPGLNQRGVIHLLIPILLLAGIIAGVYLILQGPKIFKPKAGPGETITIVDDSGNSITTTTSPTVKVKLTSPEWSSQSTVSSVVKDPTSAINYSSNSSYLNWQNPKGVLTDDASYANVANLGPGKLSNTGSVSGFGFSIPTDAGISGVLVEVKRGSSNGTGVVDKDVRIGVGRRILSPENKAKSEVWPNTESYVSYGGSQDKWGLTLTPAEVNDPNFGVGLQVGFADTGTGTDRAGVNHVRMTIFYTLPSPPPATTASVTLAEDPNFSVNSVNVGVGTTYYTFSTSTPGTKTLYAKFLSSDGRQQNANPYPATVELLAPTPIPSGLVSYWSLDETNKNGVINGIIDSAGNNPGTIPSGSAVSDIVPGKVGNGKSFNGTNNSRIDIGDKDNLELTTFTIAGWIKLTGSCPFGTCPIFSKGQSGKTGYSLEVAGSKAVLNIRDSLDKVTGATIIPIGEWHFIAGSADGTTLRIYVDGVKDGEKTQAYSPTFSTESAKIGSRNGASDITANGVIDEVGIWNRVLSESEISSLYLAGGGVKPSPTPTPSPSAPPSVVLNKKVLLVIYNPVLSSGQKLYQSRGWNDPYQITNNIIADLKYSSGGVANYTIAETAERNEFPRKIDGFRYTESTYNDCRSDNSTCHNPDEADYNQMWTDLNICSKVSSGQIDEVWLWGAGFFGFDEFAFKIPGDKVPYNQPTNYWLYTGRIKNIPDCNGKTVFAMGWIPEVGEDNALHSFGHRSESALALTVGRGYWDGCVGHNGVASDFDHFTCLPGGITQTTPVQDAGCGNVHSPPNTNVGYDYGNAVTLPNACESWYSYPFTTKTIKNQNCTAWGCNQLDYMKWWFGHFPKAVGVNSNGNLNNWWKYAVDFDNGVSEAKGN